MNKHEIIADIERLIKHTRGPARSALKQALHALSAPSNLVGLSDTQIRNHTASGGRLYDAPPHQGLFLFVTKKGVKIWRLRDRSGGKDRLLTLGTYPDMSLTAARQAQSDHLSDTLTHRTT